MRVAKLEADSMKIVVRSLKAGEDHINLDSAAIALGLPHRASEIKVVKLPGLGGLPWTH